MTTQSLAAPPPDSGLEQITGPSTNGIIQMLRQRRNLFEQARLNEQRYGPVHVLNMFGTKWVAACGPNAAETILMNKAKAFANGPGWSPLIGNFFDRGLMLLDFEEHRHHRTIMQQAFTPTVLKGYLQELQPIVARHIAALPVGSVEDGNPVPIYQHLKKMTLDVALEVFLGAKLPRPEADRINAAFIACLRASGAILRRPLPGSRWSKGVRGRRVLEEFLVERIDHARGSETADLLSVMCHAESGDGHRFSDQDIVDHMIFLLMAAHDTTTTTLANMVYYTAKTPRWQDRARAQSMELNIDLSFEDLSRLTDVELVFKEASRLCPPTPLEPRRAVKDTEVCGYFVPKGTLIFVPTNVNHRRAEIWRDPEIFDPERFTKERAEDKVHRLAWAPFGAGIHKCIGLYFAQYEIKAVMHHLLRGYEWSVPPEYEMRIDISALPAPVDSLPITLSKL
ncbi:cytochrome P450 [Nocardia sp. CA-128927]|uniref:cytochrome P450 n=1 Tax=Nocardia sp. CA-128927 TaxID=3239975 RepID=UPI003D9946B3